MSILFITIGVITLIFTEATVLGWLLIVFGILAFFVFGGDVKEKEEGKKEEGEDTPRSFATSSGSVRQSTMGGVSVTMTTGETYSIKGINYHDVDNTMLGENIGYIRALKSNVHDPYAISVYVGNKMIGFLPRGNRRLHETITAMGGRVPAEIFIDKARDEDDPDRTFFWGRVTPMIDQPEQ